ncbi:MAG: biopolymer transporter ExbD [Oligoflexales bacterium]|nr:biopolymer transporter ExbD [Oligoflexales bacterium]
MSHSSDDEEEITSINVTPFVDVMLVLLIIFMVTASYIANRSIGIQLPKAETSDASSESARNLAFTLDAQSQLSIDGKHLDFASIPDEIAASQKKNPDKPLSAIISADKLTPHGDVVRLIDMIRKHGITDFAIHVEVSP